MLSISKSFSWGIVNPIPISNKHMNHMLNIIENDLKRVFSEVISSLNNFRQETKFFLLNSQ